MGLFSGGGGPFPYAPSPAAPPPVPNPVSQDAVDAAARTKATLAAAGGYSGTIATGGQGVTAPAQINSKKLLGE